MISVIVPTYNEAAVIDGTLSGLLRLQRRALRFPHGGARQVTNAIAVCTFVGTLAATPLAQPALTWSYASSDHFEVYASGNEKHAREAVQNFERSHAFFEHLLGLPPHSAPRTRLIVFSTAKEFARYSPNENSNAFWLGTPDGDFIVMHALNTDQVVVHEDAHLMIGRAGIDFPLWLNEGLANFYSTMRLEGSKMRVGLPLPHAMETLSKAGTLIPLDRLFAIDDRSPENHNPRVAALLYAESWALTHMLLTHEQYRDRSAALLVSIARGTPAADALQATYGKSSDAIAADLRKYLLRFRRQSTLIDMPDGPRDMHITSRPADDVDVEVTLASVLGWQRDREDQSRALMEALETRVPQSLRLAEARGLFEHYTGHCAAARTFLAKAVALGSVNPTVLRSYATVSAGSEPESRTPLAVITTVTRLDGVDARLRFTQMPCGGDPAGTR